MAAGYRGLFSAHGGFVNADTYVGVPRFGVSSDHSALALMMELEGISLRQFQGMASKTAPSLTLGGPFAVSGYERVK